MPNPDAPGVLLVSHEGSLVASTEEGTAWMRSLGLSDEDLAAWIRNDRDARVVRDDLGRHACAYVSPLGPELCAVVVGIAAPTSALPEIMAEHGLTPREQEVLDLLLRGHSDRQIADALVIALDTAREHSGRVLRKLNVARRAELAARLFPGFLVAEEDQATSDQGS